MAKARDSILDEDTISIPSISRDTNAIQPYDVEARAPTELAPLSVDEPAILSQVEQTASSLMSGEIPQDVVENVERITAERGIQGGFGLGQAAEFVTARGLGLTSIDLMDRGAAMGLEVASRQQAGRLAIAELNNQRQQFNENMNMKVAEMQNRNSQWNDQMISVLSDVRRSEVASDLAVMELASSNAQFINQQITDMIIQNARDGISGLQQHIDTLAESADVSTAFLYALFDIER